MKIFIRWATLVAFLSIAPNLLFGEAEIQEWVGVYEMNHDGFPGTLDKIYGVAS
jgi:hypothetical protein